MAVGVFLLLSGVMYPVMHLAVAGLLFGLISAIGAFIASLSIASMCYYEPERESIYSYLQIATHRTQTPSSPQITKETPPYPATTILTAVNSNTTGINSSQENPPAYKDVVSAALKSDNIPQALIETHVTIPYSSLKDASSPCNTPASPTYF